MPWALEQTFTDNGGLFLVVFQAQVVLFGFMFFRRIILMKFFK